MSYEVLMRSLANFLSQTIQSTDFNIVRANSKKKICIYSFHQKKRIMTPWVRIPNVRFFQVNTGQYDLLFKLFGLRKKTSSTIEMTKNENQRINRFVIHQIIRLDKLICRPFVFWRLSYALMKRSNSFRVLAINHVFHNWHRHYPLSFILKVNRKCSKLINEKRMDLDFHRVYIPKIDGLRPLGVPAPEWRLYLHMVSQFLTFYLQPQFTNQHGFLPGRGCLSAWKEIFTKKLWEQDYIKEWDFKDFFGQVKLFKLSELLERSGIPKELVYLLENINRSNIKYCSDFHPEYEKKWTYKRELEDALKMNRKIPEDSPYFKAFESFMYANEQNGKALIEQFMLEEDPNDPLALARAGWRAIIKCILSFQGSDSLPLETGVAQGSPTSPISVLPITQLWVNEGKRIGSHTIMYADDSVDFSMQPIDKDIPKDTGIIINETKSGYVKWAGKWLKPLKFLGLTFDGQQFRASTRKGSTLPLTFREKLLLYIIDRFPPETSNFEDQVAWLKQVLLTTFPETRLKEIISEFDNKTHTVEIILEYLLKEAEQQGTDIRTLFPKDTVSPPKTMEAKIQREIDDQADMDLLDYSPLGSENKPKRINSQKSAARLEESGDIQSWERIFKSKFIGFVQSRLYGGKWNQPIVQNFHLTSSPGSWLDSKLGKDKLESLTIYNASSYACHSLLNILRYSRRRTERQTGTLVRFMPLRNVRSPKGSRKLQ